MELIKKYHFFFIKVEVEVVTLYFYWRSRSILVLLFIDNGSIFLLEDSRNNFLDFNWSTDPYRYLISLHNRTKSCFWRYWWIEVVIWNISKTNNQKKKNKTTTSLRYFLKRSFYLFLFVYFFHFIIKVIKSVDTIPSMYMCTVLMLWEKTSELPIHMHNTQKDRDYPL